jgi:adenylate kinase
MKPVIVGIYGVSGCGKSYLVKQLEAKLGKEQFNFYDGSGMIAQIVPGGLEALQKLGAHERQRWRERAIDAIGKECADSGRVGIVAGHYILWLEGESEGEMVCSPNDLNTYTHILYLRVPPPIIAERRAADKQRARPPASVDHLHDWQEAEMTQLRNLCRHHGILFSMLSPDLNLLSKASTLLHDFRTHSEEYNRLRALARIDEVILAGQGKIEKMLVMDADRTLSARDSGALFWEMCLAPMRGHTPEIL